MITELDIDWKSVEVAKNVFIGDWVTILYEHHKAKVVTAQLNNRILKARFTSTYPAITFLSIFLSESILKDSRFEIVQRFDDGCIAEYKCGLVREDGSASQIYVQIHLKTNHSINDESNILIYDDDEVKINLPIKYVHELQHMLDMCGLPSNKIVNVNKFIQEFINTNIERLYNDHVKRVEQEFTQINYKLKNAEIELEKTKYKINGSI